MIDNQLDTEITCLQASVHKRTMEIYRLQEQNLGDLKKMRELSAERDRISGLKTRVMDSEVQAMVSYHGGPMNHIMAANNHFTQEQIDERIETLKRRYYVVRAKVASNYKPEYHRAQADAYKDVLILFGIPEADL